MKYEIERKAPGDITYIKIGELNPQAGSVLTNHDYQSTNVLSNVNAGTVSYRIRQIIDTAAASFTAIYIDTAEITIYNCLHQRPTQRIPILQKRK